MKYIVFVKYNVLVPSGHYMLDDDLVVKSEIVEVGKLVELNKMFQNIVSIEILDKTEEVSNG